MNDESYCLVLAKEDFKFSCAHFTLFNADEAEHLHGHNYQVGLEVEGRQLDDFGLLTGFAEVKTVIRRLCRDLDSRTLVPTQSPHVRVEHDGGDVLVRFRERRYRFPAADVVLLPLVNTSIELLARYLWQALAEELGGGSAIERLGVEVAETAGQGCWFRASLPAPRA